MAALFEKYAPVDRIAQIEMKREMNALSMGKEENPDKLIESLSAIENKYNTQTVQINEDDKIAIILEKAPAQYQSILTAELRAKADKVKVKDLHEAMKLLFRALYGKEGAEIEKQKEIQLASVPGQITCYRCKKPGHKAFQCPEKQ